MTQYLIVTHKTALAPELHAKVGELVSADSAAEFGILVPANPGESHTWEGESLDDGAQQSAEALNQILEKDVGANVVRIAVGVEDPLQAISDELGVHRGYDTLLICTLPLGVSRWLRTDLVHNATRKFGLPIIHVVGTPPPT